MINDRVFGTIMIVVAVFFLFSTYTIQTSFLSDPLGPRFFPYLIGIVLLLSSLVLLINPDEKPQKLSSEVVKKIMITVGVFAGFAFFLNFVGFIFASITTLFFLSRLMGASIRAACISSIGTTVLLYFIFNNLLGLNLKAFPNIIF